MPAQAQPLTRGIKTDHGLYLVDEGSLRRLNSDGSLSTLDLKAQKILQPKGWSDRFVALTEEEALEVTTSRGGLTSQPLAEGEKLNLTALGDQVLIHGAERLILLGETSRVERSGEFSAFKQIGDTRALLKSGEQHLVIEGGLIREFATPFPEAQLTLSDDGAYFWNAQRTDIHEPFSGTTVELPEPPSLGLKALPGGGWMATGSSKLMLLEEAELTSLFDAPAKTAEEFAQDRAFLFQGTLHYVSQRQGEVSVTLLEPGEEPGSYPLPEASVHQVLPGGDGNRPLIFLTLEVEEPTVDDYGEPVLDLLNGEPATHKVNGHAIYGFTQQGEWERLASESRQSLVGPVQAFGETVVYATQTEPDHRINERRHVNYRYPYPQVILRGLSATSLTPVWSQDVPRGGSPSKARLPGNAWPSLGPEGPLLVTSEDDRLLAFDPKSGELQWTSPNLPMDESSPLMVRWDDRLGLVAAKATTRRLLVVDPTTGQLLSKPSLIDTFDYSKTTHLVGVVVICLALAYYIYAAGKRELYIRKIAGLQALEEAVGRATEMGKPVLYVTGLADVDDIQTLASLSILSHVARKTAEYDTPIVATTSRAVTYSAAQEVVKDAFTIAGRPDAFSVDSVRYISDDQFGYTAGVDGIMLREEPAANFYMGKFYGESLILAETGHATGAIQIAGTAMPAQLPFFVAACDYTLIGEELFAASAYLSRDPLQVGSLRGQDVGKAIVMAVLLLGGVYVTYLQITGGAS